MRSIESITQGLRAIFENKLRSSLTLLGIMIGVAAVLAMVSISDGARAIIVEDIERFGGSAQFMMFRTGMIQKNGRWVRNNSPEYFDYNDVLAIERECPSVEIVIPRIPQWWGTRITTGEGANARETRAGYQGVTPAMMEGMEWYPEVGRFVEESDKVDWNRAAILGQTVVTELFGSEDPLGAEIRVNDERFDVVGTMEHRGKSIQYGWDLDNTVIMPMWTAQQRFNGSDEIRMLAVQANNTDQLLGAMGEVEALMDRRHNGDEFYRTWSPGTSNLEFVEKLRLTLTWVLGIIAGFSLFIGGVGIMNIMLVSVTERTREIGLRKALGGRRTDILIQFLIEAASLCVVGGVFGLVLGIGFGWSVAKLISTPQVGGFIGPLMGLRGDWVAWPFSVSGPWIIASMLVSVAIGVFFGLYPAWKAARLTPVDALRHQ
ncbi:FtsX-like permease family protein [Candidatus Poribacteria bacterium]|jgi:putative ABC transport system permease protein|nr:FtsX-like permease family protein [Candidatus Poribacteria bacterium]MBT7099933.1 FtsX-like permease family protein [Candidatus Poribacteria bacterium]MBT7808935.1 FtsX-like permease family protein [Candidatus Poribacteria bacterium]